MPPRTPREEGITLYASRYPGRWYILPYMPPGYPGRCVHSLPVLYPVVYMLYTAVNEVYRVQFWQEP